MLIKITLVFLVLCAVIATTISDRGYCGNCKFIPYRRIKRGKYFPGPPQRFYSRPPVSFPYIGAISYTPPPNYMSDDNPPYPGPGPYKVSKRPTNEGLGDEDINNIMKYLTKQDLDKLLEFANEKQNEARHNEKLSEFSNGYNKLHKKREEINVYKVQDDDYDIYNSFKKDSPLTEENRNLYKANVQEIDSYQKHIFKTPFKVQNTNEYTPIVNYVTERTSEFVINVNDNDGDYNPSETQQRILNKPNVNAYNNQNINHITTNYGVDNYGVISDTKIADEEYLPRPVNLREGDFYGSYTNNVPNVVKADTIYEIKNFGELPLMNYNSKLDTVSSYHVPHYTVTTSSEQKDSSTSQTAPIVEPAPSISVGQEQSDAHLKAIKIWSHKSKGTAYTLHNDGTLSLERPTPTRRYNGFP